MIPVNAPHPLAQLMQSVKDGNGWTDREIARRIEAAGMSLSHSYVGKLQNHPVQTLTAATIRALAVGLGIPESDVAMAAVASMGVHIDPDSSGGLDVAIANEQSFTGHDKRILRAVVKEMRTNAEERRAGSGEALRGADVPGGPVVDGATTAPTKADFDRAAMAGVSELDRLDAEADARGEESQDAEGWQ